MLKIKILLVLALIGIISTIANSFPSGKKEKVSVCDLTVEGRHNPKGLDETNPRLGWKITGPEKNIMQDSYHLIISSSLENALNAKGDVWDSGNKKSGQSQWIDIPLKMEPDTEYFWRVKITTNNGDSEWSPVSSWSTGLLSSENWTGKWIGLDSLTKYDTDTNHTRLASRYLRKEFRTGKEINRATLHISGIGNYVAEINGQRVGDDVLTPLPTDYDKTVAYDTYDVTPLLSSENAIGVVLSGGHYFAQIQKIDKMRKSFGYPKLIADLVIEYTDGTKEIVATDNTWKLSVEGPVRYANEYDGEFYDTSRELGPWTRPGFNDSAWDKAEFVSPPKGALRGSIAPNMTVYNVERPISIKKFGKRYIADFGTNNAGRIRMNINASKGDTVTIRHAELLLPGDSLLYTDNLRSAEAANHFIADGKKRDYVPDFTFQGFRFIEITGVDNLAPGDLTRELIADPMDDKGYSITIHDSPGYSGADLLNTIIDNARRGIRSNYKGMPLDCPQRDERMPWLGDRTTGCLGESYLMNNHALYSKWLGDIRDSQLEDGSISDVSPSYWQLYSNNMTWPAALPFAAEMINRQYGDPRPADDSYNAIDKFMKLVHDTKYKDGIVTHDVYGDWCVPPESPTLIHSKDPERKTDGKLIATSYFHYISKMMAKQAEKNGLEADRKRYSQWADETRRAINREFLHDGNYSNATATANLLPLAMNIVPDSLRQTVTENLLETICGKNKTHLSAGVIGIQWLMRQLSEIGKGDIAYTIATNEDYPSWGYMVKNGATTIWELWNGDTADPAMNSGNHVMLLGDLIPWCYEYLAGIRPDDNNPGFRHIILKPDFSIEAIGGVDASHPTPYGTVVSSWAKNGNEIEWNVSVPANTTATVYLPDGTEKEIGSGDYRFNTPSISDSNHKIH